MNLLQCGKVWKTSPQVTRHHPPALWRINNWQTIWMRRNTIHTSCNPHTCTADKWRRRAQGLQNEQEKEGTRPRRCDTSLSEILCWPAGLHLCTDHWSCAKSPHAPNAPPSSLSLKEPKISGLNDYRPVALTFVAMKSFGRLVLAYLKDTTGPPAVCLQSKQVCGWSQHGTALHPAASGQTRDLCEDPVCRLQLRI